MEKNFLTVIHEAEIMDPQSLEMLKGGTSPFDCQSFSCTCYKKLELSIYSEPLSLRHIYLQSAGMQELFIIPRL
jgi:hypothetical protein